MGADLQGRVERFVSQICKAEFKRRKFSWRNLRPGHRVRDWKAPKRAELCNVAALGACGTHRHTWDEGLNCLVVSLNLWVEKYLACMLKMFSIATLRFPLVTSPTPWFGHNDAMKNTGRGQKGTRDLPFLKAAYSQGDHEQSSRRPW